MEYQYGNENSPVRQLDIPYANPFFYTIPEVAPGRIMADDFVYFSFGKELNPSNYNVVVESMDTAGTKWRNIGQLSERVHLPFVKFSPYGKIGVVPVTDKLPLFSATLVRGATYIIPNVRGQNGEFSMSRHGGKY